MLKITRARISFVMEIVRTVGVLLVISLQLVTLI